MLWGWRCKRASAELPGGKGAGVALQRCPPGGKGVGWDLGPFAAALQHLYLDISPQAIIHKEAAWDWKQLRAGVVRADSGQKPQTTEKPNCYSNEGKSRVPHMPPAHTHTPTLTSYKEHAYPSLSKRVSTGTCCLLLPPTAAGIPIIPCLHFLSGL